jgi:hypothetical protein
VVIKPTAKQVKNGLPKQEDLIVSIAIQSIGK